MAIGQVVTTTDLPERDRMAFWVEAVCETFLELKVDSRAGSRFHGAIETVPVGPLAFNFMSFDDQHIVRTRQSISRGKVSEFYLIQPRDRTTRFAQLGREIEVAPGGCTLLDSRYPFTIDNDVDRDCLSVAIPTDWLLTWLPSPEEVVARHWQPGREWGGVLAGALSNLDPATCASLPVLPSVFCDQLGALLSMAASSGPAPGTGAAPSLADRLLDTLRGTYHEMALDPALLARHHGISVRTLHLEFARVRTTFGAELLRIRLDNAKRLLVDPSTRRLQVAEVGIRCGFANASHFARRFKQRYGLSPTELRHQCRG